jgi:DNA-binding GntR family transcriptional regulator
MIDPTSDRPVYKQLADILRGRIETGEFRAGEILPSAASLADSYVVGPDTVRRALALMRLEADGQTELMPADRTVIEIVGS